MSANSVVLGIDLGTTGVKVVCLDPRLGRIIAAASTTYPSYSPHAGAHEQEPAEWWAAVVSTARQVIADVAPLRIEAVGLSGHMHTLLLVDDAGVPVSRALTWAERRVGQDTARLAADIRFSERGCNEMTDVFTAPKLAWLARTQPDAMARARHLLLAKDYIRYRLTGEWCTDETDAMATMLYDVRRREWVSDLWSAAGGSVDWAPRVVRSTEVSGVVSPSAASEIGLVAGTPVLGGAGDVSAAVLGTGVVDRDQICLNVGTAAQVMGLSQTPNPGPGFSFGSASDDGYITMVSVYAAGASIRWAERALLNGGDVNTPAASAAAGSSGLTYLPFMFGSTVPRKNDAVRAAFIGQTESHGLPEFARAVIEGIAFGCAQAIEAVADVVGRPREVRVVGGVSNSLIWRQTLASVLNVPIGVVAEGGSARGAAICAALGTGHYSDASDAARSVTVHREAEPDDGQRAACADAYAAFRESANALV